MTERDERGNAQRQHDDDSTFTVPGSTQSIEDMSNEEVASSLQQARDLGSASRSCVAIIAVLLFMVLLICVFLTWAWFIR